MINKISVPDNYKYVLDRGQFEYTRSLNNVVFMLNEHIKDNDDAYLDSDLHKTLQKRVETTLIQKEDYMIGVLYNMFDDLNKNIPKEYFFEDENRTLLYK